MFGRENDELDDYRREQEEIRREKKKTNSAKPSKIKKKIRKENMDGSITYTGKGEKGSLYFFVVFICIMMIMPFIILMTTGEVNSYGDAITGFVFVVVIVIVSSVFGMKRFFGKNAKAITVDRESIDISTPSGKKLTYSCNDYLRMEYQRHYGKHHRYSRTTYTMVFKGANGDEERINFCSERQLVASDFNAEVMRRKSSFVNDLTEISDAAFALPEELKKHITSSNKAIATIVFVMMIMFGFIAGMDIVTNSGITSDSVGLIFVFVIFAFVFIVGATSGAGQNIAPGKISFISGSIIIDDLRFDAGKINSIFVTILGLNDPRCMSHSTIHIVDSNGEYVFLLGKFYSNRGPMGVSNNNPLPDWPYEQLYTYMKNWAKVYNVKFGDYII